MAKEHPAKVWVIIHCELMQSGHFDEMVFHVASSLRRAEHYINDNSTVASHSWWKLQVYRVDVDSVDDDPESRYYSHKGKLLKSAPVNRALSMFQRWKKQTAA